MTSFVELLDSPCPEDPFTAGMIFVSGAAIAVGAMLVGRRVLNEELRRRDCRECER
jgi:hypothetical protein